MCETFLQMTTNFSLKLFSEFQVSLLRKKAKTTQISVVPLQKPKINNYYEDYDYDYNNNWLSIHPIT